MEAARFLKENVREPDRLLAGRRFLTFGDNVYLVPEETPELSKIRVLRPGLQAGTLKKGRMEPAHALALFLKKGRCIPVGRAWDGRDCGKVSPG